MQHNQNSINAYRRGLRRLAINASRRELTRRLESIDAQIDKIDTRHANQAAAGLQPAEVELKLLRGLHAERERIAAALEGRD
jgi:hypothetical protein